MKVILQPLYDQKESAPPRADVTRFVWRWMVLVLLAAVILIFPRANARAADELVLLIQPILSEEKTQKAFRPLADYIAQATGKKCRILTQPNFISYWDTLRRNSYHLALDAAHFTDYRGYKMGFQILAKVPDSVSYSLIVSDNNLVIDPIELVGKRVATLGPPSIGAARLNAMFPNPSRQPVIIEVPSVEQGMELLLNQKVVAAILPTPVVSQRMAQGGIAVVTTTEPIPHIALSASPNVPQVLQDKIRSALVQADKTEAGKKMLKDIGFEKFDPATPAIYANQGGILKEYWGY